MFNVASVQMVIRLLLPNPAMYYTTYYYFYGDIICPCLLTKQINNEIEERFTDYRTKFMNFETIMIKVCMIE